MVKTRLTEHLPGWRAPHLSRAGTCASPHRGQATYALARRLAESALRPDADEHRRELVALVGAAQSLAAKQ